MPVKLNWLGAKVRTTLREAAGRRMDAAGKAVVAKAKELAPKRTGYLESTIGYTFDQSNLTLTIHVDAYYAYFVERGTLRMRARPFLGPALREFSSVIAGAGIGVVASFPNVPEPYSSGAEPNVGPAKVRIRRR